MLTTITSCCRVISIIDRIHEVNPILLSNRDFLISVFIQHGFQYRKLPILKAGNAATTVE